MSFQNADLSLLGRQRPLNLAFRDAIPTVDAASAQSTQDLDRNLRPHGNQTFQNHAIPKPKMNPIKPRVTQPDSSESPFHPLSLWVACGQGDLERVRACYQKRPSDLDAADPNRDSPLHVAAGQGYLDVSRFLLQKGARVDKRGRRLRTPLMSAAGMGYLAVIKLLLDHGADPYMRDRDDNSALDLIPSDHADYETIRNLMIDAARRLHGGEFHTENASFTWLDRFGQQIESASSIATRPHQDALQQKKGEGSDALGPQAVLDVVKHAQTATEDIKDPNFHAPSETMFMHYTISEDRSEDREGFISAKLAAFGARCESRQWRA